MKPLNYRLIKKEPGFNPKARLSFPCISLGHCQRGSIKTCSNWILPINFVLYFPFSPLLWVKSGANDPSRKIAYYLFNGWWLIHRSSEKEKYSESPVQNILDTEQCRNARYCRFISGMCCSLARALSSYLQSQEKGNKFLLNTHTCYNFERKPQNISGGIWVA